MNYLPNPAHYFLKVLQDKEKLSKYFTQNIDGLERLAGKLSNGNDFTKMVLNVTGLRDEKIVEAHGTFSAAGCVSCGESYDIQALQQHIMNDEDAKCRSCGGWVKPNIVFFGEQLPARFFDEAEMDCTFCDLLICIGTSLEVYPFAGSGQGNLDQVVLIQNEKMTVINLQALWMHRDT